MLVCQNETATGVKSDVAAIRGALDSVKHPALLLVDSVSALASMDFRMDEWGVDVCVSGSQKGLMLPAGLGITCVSQKALEAAKTLPRGAAISITANGRPNASGYFPYTPSVPMMCALRESLAMLAEEGLENIFRVTATSPAECAPPYSGLEAQAVCMRPMVSDTVSAVMVPEGVDAAASSRAPTSRYNLSLGAGLSQVAGKLFRIGHWGTSMS